MDDENKKRLDEIMMQDLDPEEFERVAGGFAGTVDVDLKSESRQICVPQESCAATVEDGSWCRATDACFNGYVTYTGMKDCSKAWH